VRIDLTVQPAPQYPASGSVGRLSLKPVLGLLSEPNFAGPRIYVLAFPLTRLDLKKKVFGLLLASVWKHLRDCATVRIDIPSPVPHPSAVTRRLNSLDASSLGVDHWLVPTILHIPHDGRLLLYVELIELLVLI
jgi:hypothetical protein